MNLVRKQHGIFPTLFNDFFDQGWSQGSSFAQAKSGVPAVNIKETDDEFVIDVAAPGMNKEDFSVDLDRRTLTISAEHKSDEEKSEGNYKRREFNYSSFQRAFRVPVKVDEEKISAKYENGVLKVVLPKKEVEEKEVKQIEIG